MLRRNLESGNARRNQTKMTPETKLHAIAILKKGHSLGGRPSAPIRDFVKLSEYLSHHVVRERSIIQRS